MGPKLGVHYRAVFAIWGVRYMGRSLYGVSAIERFDCIYFALDCDGFIFKTTSKFV